MNNALALPALLYGWETLAIRERDKNRITSTGRKFVIITAKYTCFNYQLDGQFLYSVIYVLHQIPRHVSSNTMLIFRRSELYFADTEVPGSIPGATRFS
jgi:hypothetical protein